MMLEMKFFIFVFLFFIPQTETKLDFFFLLDLKEEVMPITFTSSLRLVRLMLLMFILKHYRKDLSREGVSGGL